MKPWLLGSMMAFCLFAGVNAQGVTARDLLTSPAPQLRELGARILLQSYVPPARTDWDIFVKRLKPGMKRAEVEDILHSENAVPGSSVNTGTTESQEYRLDDLWVVNCSYTNAALFGAHIEEHMNNILVPVPANYSGEWITYWVNGQRYSDRHYQYGELDGVGTDYYPNGTNSVVYFYHNGLQDGEETAYYQSGKIKWKGQYREGAQVGKWIWYKEDGKVESEKDFKK